MDARQELEELRRLEALEARASDKTFDTAMEMMEEPDIVSRFIADPSKQTALETQIQGTAAGVASIVEPAGEFLGKYIPDEVKQYAQNAAQSLFNTPPGQVAANLMGQGGEAFERLEKANPRLAKDIKASANILAMGAGAAQAGSAATRRMMSNALDETVTPYMNQANLAEMISDGRMRSGGTSKFKFVETDKVKSQKRALKTVPGFGPMQTNIKRFELVDNEIKVASQRLQQKLDELPKTGRGILGKNRVNAALSKKQVKNRFNKGLDRSEFMRDEEYDKLVSDIKFRLTSKRADGALNVGDIHKARKELDHRYRNIKGENRMAGKLNETRDERMWRVKRDIFNNMVDRAVPGTKTERARIRTLYDVRDILHQKAFKGQIYFHKDVAEKVPFIGDTQVRILPRGGR